ncbi:MAG: tRNA (adenosine(37)-N6)-threonylcarbamoyltransferase complex ATPase subunit type 1 TsaE [candidate division WOR-3 bacterium]
MLEPTMLKAPGTVERHTTQSPEETMALGALLGQRLGPGSVVAFFGELGSGKTTMIKGIARGLGVTETVRSPSFVIATHYTGQRQGKQVKVTHVDLYRLPSRETCPRIASQDLTAKTEPGNSAKVESGQFSELDNLGLRDILAEDSITLIEWADRATELLPRTAVKIRLQAGPGHVRHIEVAWPHDGT